MLTIQQTALGLLRDPSGYAWLLGDLLDTLPRLLADAESYAIPKVVLTKLKRVSGVPAEPKAPLARASALCSVSSQLTLSSLGMVKDTKRQLS
jgi:hypothetical protein